MFVAAEVEPEVAGPVAPAVSERRSRLAGDPRVRRRDDDDDRPEQDLADRLREARAPRAATVRTVRISAPTIVPE